MKKMLAMAVGDIRNIRRDTLLLASISAPVLITLVVRFAVPIIRLKVGSLTGFDLTPYYPLIVITMAMLSPLMAGLMCGFLILDERDENLLLYYSVTPLTKKGYLLYRMASPALLSLMMILLFMLFSDLISLPLVLLAPLMLLLSLEAPMMTLVIAALAQNKVEGLALSKALGILLLAPAAAFFLVTPWHYLFGIFPPYWIAKAFFAAIEEGTGYWLFLGIGLLAHLLCMKILLQLYDRRIG